MMKLSPKQLAEGVAKVRREAAARAVGRDPLWPDRFKELEREYLRGREHLLAQKRCGLCPESDRPRRKVVLPNGHALWSAWYKVPTTDEDATRALREQTWLLANNPF